MAPSEAAADPAPANELPPASVGVPPEGGTDAEGPWLAVLETLSGPAEAAVDPAPAGELLPVSVGVPPEGGTDAEGPGWMPGYKTTKSAGSGRDCWAWFCGAARCIAAGVVMPWPPRVVQMLSPCVKVRGATLRVAKGVMSASPRGRILETVGSRREERLEVALVSDAVDTSGNRTAEGSATGAVVAPLAGTGPLAADAEAGGLSTA